MLDSAFYAESRAGQRRYYAESVVLQGRAYTPKPNRRVPDYATFGGELDVRSPWLVNNMTPEQAAYARELAIERKNQRERA